MSEFKRVYHPSLNAWQDVAKGDVDGWSEQGWLKTKPKHVDDSEALPVGEFHVASVEQDVVEAPAPKADSK